MTDDEMTVPTVLAEGHQIRGDELEVSVKMERKNMMRDDVLGAPARCAVRISFDVRGSDRRPFRRSCRHPREKFGESINHIHKALPLFNLSIRFPIQRMTGTAMLLPSALYRGPSGHWSADFFFHGIAV